MVPTLDTAEGLPSFAIDLHLDEIVAAVAAGRPDPPNVAWWFTRLRDPDAVAFRHEVFRDLEVPGLRDGLADFVARMGVVEAHLTHASHARASATSVSAGSSRRWTPTRRP